MIEIPTGDGKGKLYFCKQSEEGEWHLLGEATKIESIETLEFEVEAEFPKQLAFQLMGLNVVNIVYCKNCKHRNSDSTCPLRHFDATDDYDFCSRGEKK